MHFTNASRWLRPVLALCWISLLPQFLSAEPLSDGPYVSQTPDGKWIARWVQGDEASAKVRVEQLDTGDEITIPAVGSLPPFQVRLSTPATTAPDTVQLSRGEPVFVVADTHGQYEVFARLLIAHGVIDSSLRWSFGKGHLAILGDVFDRGPNHPEILWLIYKLEQEAPKAGGAVHFVLGNHEALVLLGTRRYLHPKYLRVASILNAPAYATLWDNSTFLGKWLRSKASVIKIGDYLCLHGGISREVVNGQFTLAALNNIVRDTLTYTEPHVAQTEPNFSTLKLLARMPDATDAERQLAGFMVLDQLGPLWYRGYFPEVAREMGFPPATQADIDAIRKFYGVKAILVGHTIVPTITSLYGGAVIGVQVQMRQDRDGTPIAEGLKIEKGRMFRAKSDGSIEPLLSSSSAAATGATH